MKHLIVYAHPVAGSVNHQLLNSVLESLKGHEVQVRDLNQLAFNPVLSSEDLAGQRRGEVATDVKTEQDFIGEADVITFIYPIWWAGLPAILKGYVDRVFSYGFAYRYEQGVQEGLLKGKKAVIINTHGKSHQEYAASGMGKALQLTADLGIYTYCGFEIIQHVFFDRADRPVAGSIEDWKVKVKMIYS